MNTKTLDIKRIWIYLAFAFGIAWITGLVIYLTGGLINSPKLTGNFTLALVLLATTYMGAPALANLLTRIITKEGWKNAYVRPRFKGHWLFWVLAWVGPAVLTIVGAAVFFGLYPQYFDSSLTLLRDLLKMSTSAVAQPLPEINPWVFVIAQTLQAVVLAPLLNAVPTFGEEFGWRAYLQPKLMGLVSGRKAMLLMGLIWGVWHWPVILMGHNYGLTYPGAPWLGPLAMIWFTFVLGTFLGWLTLKGRSVWPAVIGHAAINGIAGIGALLVQGTPNPLLGPVPVGLIGSIGFSIVVLVIFLSPTALQAPEETPAAELVAAGQ